MADSFAKLSSIIESARDITIEAAVSASTRLTETPTAKRPQEIANLLNSRLDREVLNGIKCVTALISSGEDGSVYFADVVKNITSTNSRIRALVMIYVEKYAESEPDTALLSINSVQKSLNDKAPNMRSASIRTLGGIKIPEIASLLLLCIKRMLSDRSPGVRSATALAIGSAYSIDGISQLQLLEFLTKLMADNSPLVVGTSIKVYLKLHPQLLKLSRKKAWAPVHANYRRYVRILPDLEDWSRCGLTDLLADYCRNFVPRPVLLLSDGSRIDVPETLESYPDSYSCDLDPDLKNFVSAMSLAAYSSSNMVIFSTIRALVLVATPAQVIEYDFPRILLKIMLGSHNDIEILYTLELISKLSTCMPEAFQGHYSKFYIHPSDSVQVASCKLSILSALFSDNTAIAIFKELQHNAIGQCREVAQCAVRAIGRCCQKSSTWTDPILQWCLLQMEKGFGSVILADLLGVVRFLLQSAQDSASRVKQVTKTIYRLSVVLNNPDHQLSEEAKASIIWTIGEFTQESRNLIAPDVLRRMLKTYSQETEKVRYEVLLLATKSFSYEIQNADQNVSKGNTFFIVEKMFEHAIHLARYDANICTRDKARMIDELFRDVSNRQLVFLFMQAPKVTPRLVLNLPDSDLFARYLKAPRWADPASLPPSSIRREVAASKLSNGADINDLRNGTSKNVFASSNFSGASMNRAIGNSPRNNRLQSLDEFFGGEDESDDDESDDDESDENESDENQSDENESDEDESNASGLDDEGDNSADSSASDLEN